MEAFTGKLIKLCSLGKLKGRRFSKRVIDNKIGIAFLSILSAVAVYVCPLHCRVLTSIYCVAHKTSPKKNCKVVGTGIKAAVLKEAIVRGSECVVEDNTVSDRAE